MKTRRHRFTRGLAALLGATTVLVCVSVAAEPAQERSPFTRPGSGPATPPGASNNPIDKLEFRGLMTIGSKTMVSLFDPSQSKSYTIRVGESLGDIKVAAFQASADSVSVEMGGRKRDIPLKKATIVPLVAAAQVPTAVGGPGPSAAGASSGSEETSQQRMARVAEEIRRRRAMRREMLQPSGQPPSGQQPPSGSPPSGQQPPPRQ